MKVNIGPYTDDGEDQKVEVHIDNYDTWSMDYTLAHIVLPMLKQLKETKHGAPDVDDLDVPRYLRRSIEEKTKYTTEGITDDLWFERWDWVLDEMIYAFDCKATKDEVVFRIDDCGAQKKEQNRISNGFRLFGKYYENLWD
jgi:hypothetical protein